MPLVESEESNWDTMILTMQLLSIVVSIAFYAFIRYVASAFNSNPLNHPLKNSLSTPNPLSFAPFLHPPPSEDEKAQWWEVRHVELVHGILCGAGHAGQ